VKVVLSDQVVGRLRKLHPEQRRRLREALARLPKGKGDVKELEGTLAGFFRLRSGRFRVVFRYNENRIEALFLEHRSLVYELFRP
jgi:mRNA interferase RelE/StbE